MGDLPSLSLAKSLSHRIITNGMCSLYKSLFRWITQKAFDKAVVAARKELSQRLIRWKVGILLLDQVERLPSNYGEYGVKWRTRKSEGLYKLKDKLLKFKNISDLKVYEKIDEQFCQPDWQCSFWSFRNWTFGIFWWCIGVMYDLLGRFKHEDIRDRKPWWGAITPILNKQNVSCPTFIW